MEYFLGNFLYPKHMKLKASVNIPSDLSYKSVDFTLSRNMGKYNEIHKCLYNFNIERLSQLIDCFQFAYLYCHYYTQSILLSDHRVTKSGIELN